MCGKPLGLVCSCLSFILNLTAIIGNHWLGNDGSELFHEGIWQRCSNNTCVKINGKAYIEATRSLLILSTVLLQFAMVCSCLSLFNNHLGRFTASLVACILQGLAGIFLFIGLLVYTLEEAINPPDISYSYDWSYFLCWTSFTVLGIAVVSYLLERNATPTPQSGYESVEEGDVVDGQS